MVALQKSELPGHSVWQRLTQGPVKCSWEEELAENVSLKTAYALFTLDIADMNMDDECLYSCQSVYPSAKPVWQLCLVSVMNHIA